MAIRNLPSIIYLRECLDYNPDTGEFRWRERPREHFHREWACKWWNGRYAGKLAGNTKPEGYRTIAIARTQYYEHRFAWLFVHGEPVPDILDHVDGNPGDNRISNLRAATKGDNNINAKVRSDSRTGIKGVYPHHRKFGVGIWHEGKHRYLGLFDTLEEATAIRRQAEERLQGEFARRENNNGD